MSVVYRDPKTGLIYVVAPAVIFVVDGDTYSSIRRPANDTTLASVPGGCVPLVPQTEVEGLSEAVEEAGRYWKLLSAIGRELETDSGGWFYDDLPKMAAALKTEVVAAYATRDEWESNYERVAAELAETKTIAEWLIAERAWWYAGAVELLNEKHDELAEAKRFERELSDLRDGTHPTMVVQDRAAPSLPAVDSPEGLPQRLRDAAYLVDMQFDRLRCGDRPVSSILYDEADRLEREQAEKAKRDKVIDAVAVAVCNISSWGQGRTTADEVAAALLDDPRFDITLKSVKS